MQIQKRFLIASAMALLGCAAPSGPDDLRVSIVPSAAALYAGDTIDVLVTVINVGHRDHRISSKTCPTPFRVFSAEGESLGPACGAWTADRRTTVIPPYGSYTYHVAWNGDTFLSRPGDIIRTPLPPGRYVLESSVDAEDLGILTKGRAEVEIVR